MRLARAVGSLGRVHDVPVAHGDVGETDRARQRALRISRSSCSGIVTPAAPTPVLLAAKLRLALLQERPHPLGEVRAAVDPLDLGGDPLGGVVGAAAPRISRTISLVPWTESGAFAAISSASA